MRRADYITAGLLLGFMLASMESWFDRALFGAVIGIGLAAIAFTRSEHDDG